MQSYANDGFTIFDRSGSIEIEHLPRYSFENELSIGTMLVSYIHRIHYV